MKLYRVTYKEPNEFLTGTHDCEKLSVGKDVDEAMRRVMKIAKREAECFDAEEVTDVLGYSIVIGNNQQQEKYSEMLKERLKSNYEEHLHLNWNIPIEQKYIIDKVQSIGFRFDEEVAKSLLQFKHPLQVMYDNMDFNDSTYFAEALFNMQHEMQGIDLLTQKYELDKEMLLPEVFHRHKAINYLIETFPDFSAESNRCWILNYKLKNEDSMENPYEEMIEEFEQIKHFFGEETMYRVYAAGGKQAIDKEYMMFTAEYLHNGGSVEDVHHAIIEFNQAEGMTMQ